MKYHQFYERWNNCTRCPLKDVRYKVVLYRGNIVPGEENCDLFLVGEAPGVSEDVCGEPFVGPSGQDLQIILDAVDNNLDYQLSYIITNTVGCLPPRNDTGKRPPPKVAVNACAPRLQELLHITSPRKIVAVGKFAKSLIQYDAHIQHPRWGLDKSDEERELGIKRSILTLLETLK